MNRETILERAVSFLTQVYSEAGSETALSLRIKEVEKSVMNSGTYEHTAHELTAGARMAWRNSNRCVGRLFWKSLKVVDARNVNDISGAINAIQHHLDYAFNDGDILPVITIFGPSPGFRILNHQLIRFAGYPDGKGDPAELEFTQHCKKLGWNGNGNDFDVLPVVLRGDDGSDHWFMPSFSGKMIVNISHPGLEWFSGLGLQWYALPAISDMILEIGGIMYPVSPFNGWYMGTEIGSRNFGDEARYNLLPKIARMMDLDTSNSDNLWKDRALLELNLAVIHSFRKAGISIENHHDATNQFSQFERIEQNNGRVVQADWSWINPPMSSSSTNVFHREYSNQVVGPNFYYRKPLMGKSKSPTGCPFHADSIIKG